LLQATGLAAFRGERLVFRDVDFAVPEGGALLLTGPNGSGKSTLLRLLAGLLRPAAGQLSWGGQDALADLPTHAMRVAYVGHQDAVKPGLTAVENLHFAARLTGADASAALTAVGLADCADLPVRMLSAGQRRRLALARLVLSRAPLWLLDEPTLGLDLGSVERLGRLIAEHRGRGGVVVAATHVSVPLAEAAELRLA
jgi:heme exporter protein A